MINQITLEKFKDTFTDKDDEDLKIIQLFADFQRKDVFDEYGDMLEEAPFVYEAIKSIEHKTSSFLPLPLVLHHP